jgi:PTH1 family peptidyl-tRNA hydrolase
MNRSGEALAAFHRRCAFEPADCLVIVDDVYLPLGRIRLRARGSAGGHNGLASVVEAFGTLDFPRLRIGVGRGDEAVDLASHVLDTFADDESGMLSEVLDRSAEAALTWASEGITAAMNRFNVPARDARDESTPQGER